ncbi:AMP-binding protein [Pyxidicoccus fallax]|uniref:Long-chain fatty acid--CoA ligase n=1 Tax=Pyxidicoccus fallax TaxID=394095 RepID=A0A848LKZ6_9BACT|nr:AMP-binding protein [Pyxidicoccus fallax]NMO18467.1 long-chain fatty acid--CoA ligase [Pyxidicoccus fallax]NPC81678.1 AMP-binding protein [Pyxidicoccus fallax]
MEFDTLSSRLSGRNGNSIFTYEGGRVVRRTHATLHDDVLAAREALTAWGVKPGMRVGIRAPNSYYWLVHDLALIDLGAISVAFPDDFIGVSPRELRDRYSLSVLLVPAAERASHPAEDTFIASLGGDNTGVRAVDHGLPLPGDSREHPWLIFSSGSSGGLKGLVLNRRGIEDNVISITEAVDPRPHDCLLLFLPIANFQQRMLYYAALWYGADLAVTDPNRLFRALKDFQPTILVAPPTLYEAFETRFYNLPRWKRTAALAAAKAAAALPSQAAREAVARRLFRQAYETLGGRMRMMVTGMAPIKRSTLDLFALMQLPLYETYGLIEAGSVSFNLPGARKIGSVGRLLPRLKVHIAEDGELIVHCEHMKAVRYFECAPGESEKTFIGDNRVATGDIGRFDDDGYLHIVGRKKEILITAGGEKVHPEALEAEIDACPDVAKSVVFSDPATRNLLAVVLPKDLKDPEARPRIERFVRELSLRRPSRSVGQVLFTDLVFSRENGFLRPNLKLDRKRIAAHFQSQTPSAAA